MSQPSIAIAATRGGQERQASFGQDIGASEAPPVEEALSTPAPVADEAPAADAPVVTAEEFEAPAAAAEPEAPAAATETPDQAAEGERQIDA